MRTLIAASFSLTIAIVASGCGAGKSETSATASAELPPATLLDAPPAALHLPDAPGLNVEDLAARLRDSVQRASGVEVVDEISVRRELAACTEAPCPDTVAEKYRSSAFVVASSVSKIGNVFLATVRIQRGATELARTTSQAPDARVALTTAGVEAGSKLRAALIVQGVAERVVDDVSSSDVPPEESP